MENERMLNYIKAVLENMPSDWLKLTTHRLDIYEEKQAKTQFLEQFDILFQANNAEANALIELPTAFDYIRLGHPLSCILEWVVAKSNQLDAANVISFSSKTIPILAILRKNHLANKKTRIVFKGELPTFFDQEILTTVYGYTFDLLQVAQLKDVPTFEGSTVVISQTADVCSFDCDDATDFFINYHNQYGSVLLVNGKHNDEYVSEIQHVRRRETIAMTPANTLTVLNKLTNRTSSSELNTNALEANKTKVLTTIQTITKTAANALVASSGLSTQYAIVMGLIHDALEKYNGKAIKIIVPPNCYGGTNDQARRVAACVNNVEVLDLPVDGDNDMVQSIDTVLDKVANEDAIPYIIAEIPTNPRVEVPDLMQLKAVLSKARKTGTGQNAITPVFILDQTFCPNVHFLNEEGVFSTIKTIAYVSGSKFPSGGLCTAGYCVANAKAADLMQKIELHLTLCDNEATPLQYELLAKQLPSMNQRIHDAYINTREFVNFISAKLPDAKLNFVSEELAEKGFTPSVFSLDLPTKGNTPAEKEAHKRMLNLKLINRMIQKIPQESKFCVSYGQLKGCYWTIPATSTQGTTKEADKDYIVRVALAANVDLELHKKVFSEFVEMM